MDRAALLEKFKQYPKVELHVHLEGSTRPETLVKLAKKNNISLPCEAIEDLREWWKFTGWDHFLEVYLLICSCIKSAEDIEILAREFLEGQKEQNIIYTEFTFTAWTHFKNGIAIEDQLAALGRARDYGKEQLGIDCGIVLDIPRCFEECQKVETMEEIARWCIAGKPFGVVALGLAGSETDKEPRYFESAFEIARAAGLGSTPHAGELLGPDSIIECLDHLKATRIGHGIRSIESDELIDRLIRDKITLEVCPSSNVCIGVVKNIASHPLPQLLNKGVLVTINSDDPPLFNTTLTQEYVVAVADLGIAEEEIEKTIINAARAAYLPSDKKDALIARLEDEFAMLRADNSV